MKEFKLTIVIHTEDDFDKSDFVLLQDDVIDGFQLTREENDGSLH
jgi:hypothetical protein